MSNFAAKSSSEGGRLVVFLSGECDITVRGALAAALRDAVDGCDTVVVDLTGLTFLDSSGIHELVTAHHAARDRQGELYLRNASGIVATVLQVTGVGDLLALHSEEDGPTRDHVR